MSLTIATMDDDPNGLACVVLGGAIRSCGGAHVGLLPPAEESAQRPERSRWSGLRTPTWRVRDTALEDGSEGLDAGTLLT